MKLNEAILLKPSNNPRIMGVVVDHRTKSFKAWQRRRLFNMAHHQDPSSNICNSPMQSKAHLCSSLYKSFGISSWWFLILYTFWVNSSQTSYMPCEWRFKALCKGVASRDRRLFHSSPLLWQNFFYRRILPPRLYYIYTYIYTIWSIEIMGVTDGHGLCGVKSRERCHLLIKPSVKLEKWKR